MIIIVRENVNGVFTREGDFGFWINLQGFCDVIGYNICRQNLQDIFSMKGTKLSFAGETSENGVDSDLRTLFLHPLGKMI